jgi:hypothetical protein
MNNLEHRLREVFAASVENATPTIDFTVAVRRRHRRWLVKVASASVLAVSAIIAAGGLAAQARGGHGHFAPAGRSIKPVADTFPGGGRLLFSDGTGLSWLYPDGRIVRFANGSVGATLSAGKLLTWKQAANGFDYYTMNLHASNPKLVLRAESNNRFDDIQVQLSPDGTRLAYIRQQVSANGNVNYSMLVIDLATGRRTDLGAISVLPAGSAYSWSDDSTILADTPDARALVLINVITGTRSTYLTVNDPVIANAYDRARPGAGPPAYIGSSGFSGTTTSSSLAVWVAAAGSAAGRGTFPQSGVFAKPAELLLAQRAPVASYAPSTPQQMSLTWGPNNEFIIQVGAGDAPGSWRTYVGFLGNPALSKPVPYGMDGAIFNPTGNEIALQDSQQVTFLATPRPQCEHDVSCMSPRTHHITSSGTLQAWAP